MESILLTIAMLIMLNVSSQDCKIKAINITDSEIEIFISDSTDATRTYKRYNYDKNLSYFIQDKETKVFVNPFEGYAEDTLLNGLIIEFIKSRYDYSHASNRIAYGAPLEVINIVLKIDTCGRIVCCGLVSGSNVLEFEKEIIKILNEIKDSFKLSVFILDEKKYPYIKTYQFTNYYLYNYR